MQQPLDHDDNDADDNDIIYTQLSVLLTDSFISDLRYISADLYTSRPAHTVWQTFLYTIRRNVYTNA